MTSLLWLAREAAALLVAVLVLAFLVVALGSGAVFGGEE